MYIYISLNFYIGKIMSIPKKSNACDSFNDFRPVKTVSVIVKNSEYFLINKLSTYVSICLNCGFGFTKGGGCDDKVLLVLSCLVL